MTALRRLFSSILPPPPLSIYFTSCRVPHLEGITLNIELLLLDIVIITIFLLLLGEKLKWGEKVCGVERTGDESVGRRRREKNRRRAFLQLRGGWVGGSREIDDDKG